MGTCVGNSYPEPSYQNSSQMGYNKPQDQASKNFVGFHKNLIN